MNRLSSSELSFAFLVACSVKATILLIFAWIAASAARRRSAAFRHLVWAAGILGSLILPLVTLLLPAWHSAALGNAAGYWDSVYKVPQVVLEPSRESSQSITLKVAAILEEVDVVAEGTVKAMPAGTVGKQTRIRLGGDIQAPKLLNKVQPVYPAAAKAAGVEGTVILRAIIGMEGNPLSLRVVNTKVDPNSRVPLLKPSVSGVTAQRF